MLVVVDNVVQFCRARGLLTVFGDRGNGRFRWRVSGLDVSHERVLEQAGDRSKRLSIGINATDALAGIHRRVPVGLESPDVSAIDVSRVGGPDDGTDIQTACQFEPHMQGLAVFPGHGAQLQFRLGVGHLLADLGDKFFLIRKIFDHLLKRRPCVLLLPLLQEAMTQTVLSACGGNAVGFGILDNLAVDLDRRVQIPHRLFRVDSLFEQLRC